MIYLNVYMVLFSLVQYRTLGMQVFAPVNKASLTQRRFRKLFNGQTYRELELEPLRCLKVRASAPSKEKGCEEHTDLQQTVIC